MRKVCNRFRSKASFTSVIDNPYISARFELDFNKFVVKQRSMTKIMETFLPSVLVASIEIEKTITYIYFNIFICVINLVK